MGSKFPFHSESALHSEVEKFFSRHEVPFVSKHLLANGGECDMVLLSEHGGNPVCVLEFKNKLDLHSTTVADFADYFEQCFKYHISTGLPVFLGPFFTRGGSTSQFFSGGAKPAATSAFSAMAGRVNVGLFFIHCMEPQRAKTWNGFSATLRQKREIFYQPTHSYQANIWPAEGGIKLVDFVGAASKKDRLQK
jgi:hypothetical protein